MGRIRAARARSFSSLTGRRTSGARTTSCWSGGLISNTEFIDKGIPFAIEQQVGLVSFCFDVLEKKLVKKAKGFRYLILSYEQSLAKVHLSFLTLEKLAQLLINIYKEASSTEQKEAQAKPIVVCVLDKRRGSYYVLGAQSNYMAECDTKAKKK